MKVLLISDTHCRVELLKVAIEKERPEVVLHAGDFGFYEMSSIKFLPITELKAKIDHSGVISKSYHMVRKEMEKAILSYDLMTDFENYLNKRKVFAVPVYAIWGNHDDVKVAKKAEKTIPNFYLVFSSLLSLKEDVCLCGIPGGIVLDNSFWKSDKKVEGKYGNPLTTWSYIKDLIKNAEKVPRKKLVLLTHFDSYETPLLRLVAWKLQAMYVVSGHLHRAEAVVRLDTSDEYNRMMQIYETIKKVCPVDEVGVLKPMPTESVICHINIPSAEKGYCCIEI